MADPFSTRSLSEKSLCFINLILSLAFLAVSGTVSFWNSQPVTGWLLYGCGLVLAAAFAAMNKLDAGITPKALLSALCQPPLILFLLDKGELSGLCWLFLCADLILSGAYFRVWVTLPQFLFSDLLVLLHVLWSVPSQNGSFALPFTGFQLAGILVLLFVWQGGFYRKDSRFLSEKLDGMIDLFGDVYNRLQQGLDRTLVRLEQMSEQDELLSECSSSLRSAAEPVFSGVQGSVKLLEQIQEKMNEIQSFPLKSDKIISMADSSVQDFVSRLIHMKDKLPALTSPPAPPNAFGSILPQVRAISKTAEQISLLALNSSMEAARSGPAGNGFVVAAKEILKSSKQLKQDCSNVCNSLNEILKWADGIEMDFPPAVSEQDLSLLQNSISNLSNRFREYQNTSNAQKRTTALIDSQIRKAFGQLQDSRKALEKDRKMIEQVSGVIRNYQGDIRAIQQDTRNLESLAKQTYSLLRVQKDAMYKTEGNCL